MSCGVESLYRAMNYYEKLFSKYIETKCEKKSRYDSWENVFNVFHIQNAEFYIRF